jgi:hypothetical protein
LVPRFDIGMRWCHHRKNKWLNGINYTLRDQYIRLKSGDEMIILMPNKFCISTHLVFFCFCHQPFARSAVVEQPSSQVSIFFLLTDGRKQFPLPGGPENEVGSLVVIGACAEFLTRLALT